MSFWEKIRSDLEQGIAEGIDIAKESAAFVKKKAEKLTEEGKRRLTLFELKINVRREMTELGGRIYHLRHEVDPLLESEVKTIIERIENLEKRITELEGKAGEASKKTPTGSMEGEEIKGKKISH